nr:hypothetical protein [Streptomyces sp. 846.5]
MRTTINIGRRRQRVEWLVRVWGWQGPRSVPGLFDDGDVHARLAGEGLVLVLPSPGDEVLLKSRVLGDIAAYLSAAFPRGGDDGDLASARGDAVVDGVGQ